MTVKISHLSQVDARAELGDGVEIGPFCCVGPHVRLGNGCRLDSHVVIVGHTTVGERNRFWPGTVIGGEPQDLGYKDAPTRLEIRDALAGNLCRCTGYAKMIDAVEQAARVLAEPKEALAPGHGGKP